VGWISRIAVNLPPSPHNGAFRPNSWLRLPPKPNAQRTDYHTISIFSYFKIICVISDMWVHYFMPPWRYVIIPTVVLWNSINERCSCEGRWLTLLCWRICQTVELLWGFDCQIWPYLWVCCDSAPSALWCHHSDCFRWLLGVAHMESICQALHQVSLFNETDRMLKLHQ